MSQLPPPLPPGYGVQPIDESAASLRTADIATAVAIPVAPYDLTTDTECLACGYNLRGLRSDGRCPECGTAVGRSIHGNFLRFADPIWVRRLATGATLILWGSVIGLIGRAGGGVLVLAKNPLAGQILYFLGGLVGVAGTWLVTSPDPGRLDGEWQLGARRWIRFALLVGLASSLLGMIVGQTAVSHAAGNVLMAVQIVMATIGLIGTCAKFIYFRRLAMRVPDRALAKGTTPAMWGIVISSGVLVLGPWIMALVQQLGGAFSISDTVLGCLVIAAGLPFIGFGIYWLVLLFRYRRHFVAQANLAETTWHSARPAPPVERL